ncbi:MAG: hypothetical protein GY847_05490 [Proteobacteria bacterium]|nr:hypothetical protein [Pseudomonadota bacterium]
MAKERQTLEDGERRDVHIDSYCRRRASCSFFISVRSSSVGAASWKYTLLSIDNMGHVVRLIIFFPCMESGIGKWRCTNHVFEEKIQYREMIPVLVKTGGN